MPSAMVDFNNPAPPNEPRLPTIGNKQALVASAPLRLRPHLAVLRPAEDLVDVLGLVRPPRSFQRHRKLKENHSPQRSVGGAFLRSAGRVNMRGKMSRHYRYMPLLTPYRLLLLLHLGRRCAFPLGTGCAVNDFLGARGHRGLRREQILAKTQTRVGSENKSDLARVHGRSSYKSVFR